MHTYIHTYVHTYIRTYIHIYILYIYTYNVDALDVHHLKFGYYWYVWIFSPCFSVSVFPQRCIHFFQCLAFVFRLPKSSKSPQLHLKLEVVRLVPFFPFSVNLSHSFLYSYILFPIFGSLLKEQQFCPACLFSAQDCEDAPDEGQRRGEQSGPCGERPAHVAHVEHLSAGRFPGPPPKVGNLEGIHPRFGGIYREYWIYHNIPSLCWKSTGNMSNLAGVFLKQIQVWQT